MRKRLRKLWRMTVKKLEIQVVIQLKKPLNPPYKQIQSNYFDSTFNKKYL